MVGSFNVDNKQKFNLYVKIKESEIGEGDEPGKLDRIYLGILLKSAFFILSNFDMWCFRGVI